MALEEDRQKILAYMRKYTKGMKYDDWFYKGVITLDPSKAEESLDKLTANTAVIGLAFWPEAMSRSFIATLEERGHLD